MFVCVNSNIFVLFFNEHPCGKLFLLNVEIKLLILFYIDISSISVKIKKKNNYQTPNPKTLQLYLCQHRVLMQEYVVPVLVGNQGMCYSILGNTNYYLGLQCRTFFLGGKTSLSRTLNGKHPAPDLKPSFPRLRNSLGHRLFS